jgi:hypothetical protein
MMRPPVRALVLALGIVIPLAACKPSMRSGSSDTEATELAALRAEVQRLRKENADLRISPGALANEVENAIRSVNEEKAVAAFKQLNDTFPVAAETGEMHKRLEAFLTQRRAQDEEDKRIAALGFKAVPVSSSFARGDTALTLTSLGMTRRWTFDSYDEGWRFLDAEKDKKMLVARINIASRQKEPSLFGLAAYVSDGNKLTRLGVMRYRFARWSSYGAFLGTQADYRNEFSHSWKIPFTAAVAISERDLQRRPIYLVATSEGCHQRHYERFGQPPVFYMPGACNTLKQTLTVEDFKGGALAVLKRLD